MKINFKMGNIEFNFEGTLEEYLAVSDDTTARLGDIIDFTAIKAFYSEALKGGSAAVETFKAGQSLEQARLNKERTNL